MNRLKLAAALLAVFVTVACSQQQEEPVQADPALDTTEQRLSYGIAYGFGQRLKAEEVPLDMPAFALGLRHAFDGTEQLLSQEEMRQEMEAYQASRNAERAAEAEALGQSNAEAGAAFLAENANVEGVVVLESGLQYQVVEAGEGPKPVATDTVEVNYRGTLLDGTEFDSSYARNSTASFALNQVIPGWTEGLQLMSAGAKYRFFIPPELAYGPRGAGADIGPNATLIFDVELLQINPETE